MKLSRARILLLLIFLPLAAGLSLHAPLAHADDSCAITSADLDAVNAAAAQGLMAELAARRALLARVITCAKADAEALQSSLNALPVSDGAQTLQSQLSGKLDDAVTYYNLEFGKVSGAGIAGTQAIAKEVLAWRASNYESLAAQVANFTLWTNNQMLFTTAASRLQSMESVVSFVEQAAPNNELQSDLASAQSLMQTALNENTQATNALLQSLPPDQSLALIQQSLQSLSDAYQKFFDMSTILQTLLSAKSE